MTTLLMGWTLQEASSKVLLDVFSALSVLNSRTTGDSFLPLKEAGLASPINLLNVKKLASPRLGREDFPGQQPSRRVRPPLPPKELM